MPSMRIVLALMALLVATLLAWRGGDSGVGPAFRAGEGVIVVVGAGGGLGSAVALEAKRRGYIVYATVVRNSSAVSAFHEAGVEILPLDVNDAASVQTAFAGLPPVRGLIVAAGLIKGGLLELQSDADYLVEMTTMVNAVWRCSRELLPLLRLAAREFGRATIITITGPEASFPGPMWAAYGASNAAARSVANSLRLEVMQQSIDVVNLVPAVIESPGIKHHVDRTKLLVEEARKIAHYGRVASFVERFSKDIIQGTPTPVSTASVQMISAIESASTPPYTIKVGAHPPALFELLPGSWFDWICQKTWGELR